MNYYDFHIGDYAAATQHLSDEEDLVYRRLLDAYYRDERPIPADIRQACRLARARTDAMREAVETVLREFFTEASDGWRSKRADETIERHHAFLEKQRASGRASAAKRSLNGGSTTVQPPLPDRPTTVERVLGEIPTVGQPPTSHLPPPTSHSGSNEPEVKTARVPRVDPIAVAEILPSTVQGTWSDWIQFRRERRFPISGTALRKHVEFLAAYPPETQVEILNTSIRAGWQGLFAPKGSVNGNVRPFTRADQQRAFTRQRIAEAEREERALLGGDAEPVRAEVGGELRLLPG